MDIETKKAIHHLLQVWQQYSSTTGSSGHTYYLHQCMSAGENAGAFLERLGLGTEDGYGFSANEAGRAIANDRGLREGPLKRWQ
jgi:hypothetical protein